MPNLESLIIKKTKCATVDLRSLGTAPSRLTKIDIDQNDIHEYYPPQMITGGTGTLGVAPLIGLPNSSNDLKVATIKCNDYGEPEEVDPLSDVPEGFARSSNESKGANLRSIDRKEAEENELLMETILQSIDFPDAEKSACLMETTMKVPRGKRIEIPALPFVEIFRVTLQDSSQCAFAADGYLELQELEVTQEAGGSGQSLFDVKCLPKYAPLLTSLTVPCVVSDDDVKRIAKMYPALQHLKFNDKVVHLRKQIPLSSSSSSSYSSPSSSSSGQ